MDNIHTPGQANVPGREYNTPRKVWRHGLAYNSVLGHFLEMCTIPMEVLFRRKFGERWLTISNFFIGLFVLLLFTGIEWFIPIAVNSSPCIWLQAFIRSTFFNNHSPVEMYDSGIFLMPWVTVLYLLRGSYHFFRMFWDKRTYNPQHSFDDGTSIFEPLAYGLVVALNWLTKPLVGFFMLFLPKSERRRGYGTPPLINNISNVSNLIVEPLCLLLISCLLHGVGRIWLIISAIAVFIHARHRIAIRRNKTLDFHDAFVEANDTRTYYYKQDSGVQAEITVTKEAKIKVKKPNAENPIQHYPDLNRIIEELHHNNARTGS